MAIAGYDDTISYDFNGDGKITNNVDLNNDKQIDCETMSAVRF